MNSAKHRVTKLTPFEIETGFEGENPNDPYRQEQRKNPVDFRRIRDRIEENLVKRRSENEDKRTFEIGELVLLKNVDLRTKHEKFIGPFKIRHIRDQGLGFGLENMQTGNMVSRHISHMKPYVQRETPIPEPQTPAQDQTAPVRRRRKLRSYSLPLFGRITRQSSLATNEAEEDAQIARQITLSEEDSDEPEMNETVFEDALDQ